MYFIYEILDCISLETYRRSIHEILSYESSIYNKG